jgi:hypothetical protein
LEYLGKSNELARIINKLAINNEIPANLLQEIFDSSIKMPSHYFSPAFSLQSFISKKPEPLGSFTEEKIEYPPFWSEEIEDKFHLYRKYAESIDVHFDKKKTSSKQSHRHNRKDKSEPDLSTLQKLHNNIIRKIYPSELLKKKMIVKNFDFDQDKSILKINDLPVKIMKFGNQYNVLKVIFGKRDKLLNEWFYYEISDILDPGDLEGEDEKKRERSIKNAVYQLNLRIAAKAQIPDFITQNDQSFTINNEYFPII